MDKRESIQAAYKEGTITAEVKNGAFDYLTRFPDATAGLAVSFAKLQARRPVSNLTPKQEAFISSVW
jgi:hypothetical protein